MLIKKILCTIGLISISSSAMASTVFNFSPESVTIDTSVSVLNGKSGEFVYSDNRKVSQLDWQIKDTPIIKAGITWDAISWLTLNANGWTTLASSGAGMDDYDWLVPGQHHWSEWSHHPATRLNFANQYDINMTGWVMKESHYQIGAMVGYQESRFSWLSTGGHYIYNNGKIIGDFPEGERGIGYQQKFSFPYVGLSGKYVYRDFDIIAQFKFSPWVEAKDKDEHYMRGLRFHEKASDLNYYSGLVNVGYNITPHARVFTELSWSRVSNGIGDALTRNKKTGEVIKEPNSAGIQNYNYTIGAGLQYRF